VSDPPSVVSGRAPAKLTWSLRVLGTRPDGFHELEALTATVSEPHDVVTLEAWDHGITLTVSGVARDMPADPTNLAWRAAAAAGFEVAITLEKQIPAGGGLGGGSSDAAAVLRQLRDGFGLDPARAEVIAAELGSDVPVCLRGGTAWMRGRGEEVESVVGIPSTAVVIAAPPIHSSTAVVFRAWDELGGPRATRAVAAPPTLAGLESALVNDLEPAAELVEPGLAEFRRAFHAAAGREPFLAGSGSAYCVWLDDLEDARATATRVERELGVATFAGVAGVD
jgi:4-diphosphocytidyl-2-C-methyl-D-erythritol kinase